MTVGIPGTGIGGLFYLTLALAMPLVELWRTVRGRSSLARWRVVGFNFGIAAGILGALWGQAWLFSLAAQALERAQPTSYVSLAFQQVARDSSSVFSHAAAAGFVVLGLILLTVHAARIVTRREVHRRARAIRSARRARLAAAE
jgi:hypothetical protein